MPAGLERWLDKLALLSYGAYAFHGLILSPANEGLRFSGWSLNSLGQFVLFLLIVVGAFFTAWLFQSLRAWRHFIFRGQTP
jgi:peptidoglycan/LPS O-acetylase OafA/YrhL